MGFSNLLSSIRLLYRCRRFRRKTMVGKTRRQNRTNTFRCFAVARYKRISGTCQNPLQPPNFFFRHKSAPNLRKRFRLYSISPQPCFFFTKCQMGTNSGNIHMISHDDMMSCPCCILCATYIDMFAAKSINMFKRFHGVNL